MDHVDPMMKKFDEVPFFLCFDETPNFLPSSTRERAGREVQVIAIEQANHSDDQI